MHLLLALSLSFSLPLPRALALSSGTLIPSYRLLLVLFVDCSRFWNRNVGAIVQKQGARDLPQTRLGNVLESKVKEGLEATYGSEGQESGISIKEVHCTAIWHKIRS